MSALAVGWALSTKTGTASRKAVLLVLADCHNSHTGLCCPSVPRLVEETELSRSTVVRSLKDLEDAGLIAKEKRERDNGSTRSNRYVLNMTLGGVSPWDGGGVTVTPLEPELEPEEDQDLSAAKRPSKANPVWDALVAVTGFTPTTTSEKSDFGKTVRELRAVIPQTATDDEILRAMHARKTAWERHYDDARFTHRVLRGKWAELGALAVGSGSRPTSAFPELADGETF